MAKVLEEINDELAAWIAAQLLFFVASAPLIKALAFMEQNDTSYIFVVDEGIYRGIITIQGIAAKMTEFETSTVA